MTFTLLSLQTLISTECIVYLDHTVMFAIHSCCKMVEMPRQFEPQEHQ